MSTVRDKAHNDMARARVAHVIHSLGAGGAESLLIDLAPALRDAGIECVVVGLSDAEDSRAVPMLEAAGVKVYQLHAPRYDVRVVPKLMRILAQEQVNLVHTHLKHADLVGGIAARRLGLPAVSTLHTIAGGQGSWLTSAKTRLAANGRRKLADRTIAISRAQRDWYVQYAGERGVVLLGNGVADCVPVRGRDAIRAELGVPDGAILAVTVSLMRPEKGYDVLLEAIRRIPEDPVVVFALCGDGQLLETVRATVAGDPALAARVRVLGFRRDIPDLLNAADLVVHPSREDALPTALISALAAGRPVVATDVGGIPDIVSPKIGELVPAGDPEALAAGITLVSSDEYLRARCGAAARARYVERFSAEAWAERLRDLYEELLHFVPAVTGLGGSSAGRVRKVAIVSATTPFPVDNGKCVVMAGFLRYLAGRVGGNLHFLHVGDPMPSGIPLAGVELHEIGRPSRSDQIRALFVDALGRRRSFQETFTASESVRTKISETLHRIEPDLILLDTVRMAQHLDTYDGPGRRVLYYDDLFSLRYRRMRQVLRRDPVMDMDVLGNFSQFIPRRARFLTQRPLARDMLLQLEERRVAASEIRLARDVDVAVILNRGESKTLSEASGVHVLSIPPYIQIRDTGVLPWEGQPEFAFVGLLNIPHNHDGLAWFLERGLSELVRRVPDARIHVVGSGATPQLYDLLGSLSPYVEVQGYVEDLDTIFRRSVALINPLRFGSGIKIKNLEALARGVPVVTTEVGAEGIVAGSHPGMRVCADPVAMAVELARLTDPLERQRASVEARALYDNAFAPAVVEARYDQVFGLEPPLTDGQHDREAMLAARL